MIALLLIPTTILGLATGLIAYWTLLHHHIHNTEHQDNDS